MDGLGQLFLHRLRIHQVMCLPIWMKLYLKLWMKTIQFQFLASLQLEHGDKDSIVNSPSPFLYWRNYYFWLLIIMFKKRWLLLEHNWYENSSFSFPWMPNCLTWRAPLYLSVWWLFLLHSAGIFLSKEKKKWLKLNNIWFFIMINNKFFFLFW